MTLLNYEQASALTGIAVATLYAKVCRKEIPHIRLSPRLVRFDATEIRAWIEKHRVDVKPAKK